MRKMKRKIGWILMAWAVNPVLIATAQVASTSAVPVTKTEVKEKSTNPEKDYEEGLRLFALGEKGDLGAFIDSARHFWLAAEAGHAGAQAGYGLSLERGQFYDTAIDYYRKSAAQGNMEGQFRLGAAYLAGGEGVPQDLAEARKWFILAGEQGHKLAIITMVQAYLRPNRTTEEMALLQPEEIEKYTRIGLNMTDAERKSRQAVIWLERAADKDYLPALDALAAAHQSGQFGLEVDEQKAATVTAKAQQLRGGPPPAERKKSALYRMLRGDDEKKTDKSK